MASDKVGWSSWRSAHSSTSRLASAGNRTPTIGVMPVVGRPTLFSTFCLADINFIIIV
jgi:hypothetical protein